MNPLMFLMIIQINKIKTDITRNPIYRCAESKYVDEQCLTQEKLGDLEFRWLKRCRGSKVCVQLPYYGGMAGVCSIKVRSHYDGESCAKNNKCTSGLCDGSKCIGLDIGRSCNIGLGQCKKGLVCRRENISSKFYSCQPPILASDDKCEKYIDGQFYESTMFLPDYNPCELGKICNKDNCVNIASIETDKPAFHPLACKSGILDDNKCIEYESKNQTCFLDTQYGYYICRNKGQKYNVSFDKCFPTATGAYWCPTSAITETFKEWFSEWKHKSKVEEDTVLGAYRYTANKKKANELFFRYTHFGLISDADECAYDYFWKNNSGIGLKISLFMFAFVFLF